MNYKKFVTALGALLLLGASSWAEIVLKDVGGGKVEITFLFKDPASEMGVIGSFNNWTVPGEPMTKNADGLWEKTISALATDEIVYKFYSKGTYTFDDQAPDKKDDGYGGFNGLIVVADILSGLTPMKPGAAALAPPAKKGPPGRPRLTFGTETYFESDTTFLTGSSELEKSVLNAKSLWKFYGDLIPNVAGHIEITAFNGSQRIDNARTEAVSGFLFDPFFYLGGGKRPELDKFSFGIDSPYLLWETGYANSVLPAHESILWSTVSDDVVAGEGYSSFRLGPRARAWGDFTLDAAWVPNKSLKNLAGEVVEGYYTYFNVEAYGVKAEALYEMKSGTDSATGYFDEPERTTLVFGAEAYFDDFLVQGQYLKGSFGAEDAYLPRDEVAYQVVGGYRDSYETAELLGGYAYRAGTYDAVHHTVKPTAQLLYGDSDDVLGDSGTRKFSLESFLKFEYWGVAKFAAALVQAVGENPDENQVLTVKPGFVLNLDALNVYELSVETYAEVKSNSQPAPGTEKLLLNTAGAKLAFKTTDVYYKFDNTAETVFQSLLAESRFGAWTAQGGLGLRGGTSDLGAVLGVKYLVPVPEAKTPTVYAQFVYNMDPYDTDTRSTFDLTDDFGPESQEGSGLGALRVGVSWSY